MSRAEDRVVNIAQDKHTVKQPNARRDTRTFGEKFVESAAKPGNVQLALLLGAVSPLVLPSVWPFAVPAVILYHQWALSQRRRLPFRAPASWEGFDYGSPKPDGSFGKAEGTTYFGRCQLKREDLWITDSDSRQHMFVLGTTGSGKALPLDTLVLTTRGWVRNGDLQPGDNLFHPDGGTTEVMSVHPQGAVDAVRIWFEDGRSAVCSGDHLWEVTVSGNSKKPLPGNVQGGKRVMKARDIGIMSAVYGGDVEIRIPMAAAYRSADPIGADGSTPSTSGTPEERKAWLAKTIRSKGYTLSEDQSRKGAIHIPSISAEEAREIKRVAWSLGGHANTWAPQRPDSLLGKLKKSMGAQVRKFSKKTSKRLGVTFSFPGAAEMFPEIIAQDAVHEGVSIIAVEALDEKIEMSCIKTSRDDGLYVMEDFLVTHNTELLLGLVSQTFMWSSGFMFVDGKGTSVFYARVYSIAKRFGREDDLRILNFTDIGASPDSNAGGPGMMSNTANPFSKGDSDQLMNILVSIMGDGGGGDMWRDRATTLVVSAMKTLVEMRNAETIQLNVQVLREFLAIGKGTNPKIMQSCGIKKADSVSDIPEKAWSEMRTRAGMIELYLRALNGEFSPAVVDTLKGFFDSLPGFNIEKAIMGQAQEGKCNEQYNFLYMQLTKPLSTFADSFRHIFMTPIGEVDLEDVMLNRRILIVLLPALQKAQSEMQNCGKVIVALIKIMMGNSDLGKLSGTREEVIESSATKSPSAFIVVLDEVGYYMVEGIDVMMAQARSLGFMMVLAGQDMAAMQKVNKELAEITAANASTFAAGRCVDGNRTVEFIQKVIGESQVAVRTGYETMTGAVGTSLINKKDVSFEKQSRVTMQDLQGLQAGEFYFLFNGRLALANTFYVPEDKRVKYFDVNKFILIRGPADRIPNLDQSEEVRFIGGLMGTIGKFYDGIGTPPEPESLIDDEVSEAIGVARDMMDTVRAKGGKIGPKQVMSAYTGGLVASVASRMLHDENPSYGDDDDDDFDAELEITMEEVEEAAAEFSDPMVPQMTSILSRPPRFGSSVNETFSPDPRVRHRGALDSLIDEELASREAKRIGILSEPETEEEVSTPAQSAKEFFATLSNNWDKIENILTGQDDEDMKGIDLLMRSGNRKPIPVSDDPDFTGAMTPLENIVRERNEEEEEEGAIA